MGRFEKLCSKRTRTRFSCFFLLSSTWQQVKSQGNDNSSACFILFFFCSLLFLFFSCSFSCSVKQGRLKGLQLGRRLRLQYRTDHFLARCECTLRLPKWLPKSSLLSSNPRQSPYHSPPPLRHGPNFCRKVL